MRSGRLAALGAAALACASRAGACRAGPGFLLSSCSAASAGAPCSPISRCRSPMTTARCRSSAARRVRYGGGGGQALLRADLRRALFPGHRHPTMQSRAASLQQLLPGERNQGGLRQQHRQRGDRERQTLFGAAERVPLPQRDSSAGCTCNGKDQIGLAPVKIEDDPTLRKGDIVAGENGLLVAGRSADRRGAELNFSPGFRTVRADIPAPAGGGEGVRLIRRTSVMAGLDPGHPRLVFATVQRTWMPGTSPGMTSDYAARILPRNSVT